MWTLPARRDGGVVVLSALFCVANMASAQATPVGRLEGTITERMHSGALRTASVEAVRLDPEPAISFRATPDDRGHFHIASLPAGRYMIQLASATLDSLELALESREVRVVAGQTVQADFTLPAGVALRDAVCHGPSLGNGRGVVAGRGIDADTEEPLHHAKVVVAWRELTVDKATLYATRVERGIIVETGPRGEYRLCGVPTGSLLTIQLQHADRAGGVARLMVSDDEVAVVRNLSLSVRTAPMISTLDALATADPLGANSSPVIGTATVTGTVRGGAGQALADADVRIADGPPVAITDSSGRFTLNGLPAGTQLLIVRRLGYSSTEADVELRAGKTVTRDVQLVSVTSLDSVRVVAERNRYSEFEYNRKSNLFGRFLTSAEIGRRKPTELTDLFVQLGGFAVSGNGADATVMSNLARQQHPDCKESNVVVDGIPRAGVNYVPPSQVAGIEAYRDGTTAPAPYRSDCGLIVIWTKHYRPVPRPRFSP